MSESDPPSRPDEILMDLLIKQVTEGLSPAEQRALDVLDSPVASAYASDFERAAAAIALAGSAGAESLPPLLRARLEEQAQAFFASGAAGAASAAGAGGSAATAPGVRPADKVVELRTPTPPSAGADRPAAVPPRVARSGTAGWWAAAACLVLAVFGWLRSPHPTVAPVASTPPTTAPGLGPPIEQPPAAPPAQVPAPPPTPAEERAALLARPDSLKITLGATKDPGAAGMSGDVVWNPVTQQGFLHFVGLRPNDPQMHQYQLWIFDGTRDQRYPVDGGVFDVPANQGEVVVPIRASLPVRTPKAFAVTIEKPGGVVVSGRQHVVALGQAS
jgi:hypothetical protein